jgi:hypothetical protein
MSQPAYSGPALRIRHTGQIFPLTQTAITLGRHADNTIVLSDPQVSRHHASITWQPSGYVVQDLNSANGTFINEQPVSQPSVLRDGDILRLGNTVFDLQLATGGMATQFVPEQPAPKWYQRSRSLPVILGAIAGLVVVGAVVVALVLLGTGVGGSRPTVTILSPPDNSQIQAGNQVILRATAIGARDITGIDLMVDDITIASTSSSQPEGQASLTISQEWTFGQGGTHTISAVAFTAKGEESDSVSVTVQVSGAPGEATPAVTATDATTTPQASATALSPMPPTDTPEPEATTTDTPTPTVEVTSTPSATPTEAPLPAIEYFRANPEAILSGECALLEWGTVEYAAAAIIDQGIGGVGTPGQRQVCPEETTTYTLQATGEGGSITAQTTITVSSPLADLVVDSITFDPPTPVQGEENIAILTFRNAGNGPANAFRWDWQAGSAIPVDGTIDGLGAGESISTRVRWLPLVGQDSIATVARVDIDDQVPESNTDNNSLTVEVEPVGLVLGDLAIDRFELDVDASFVFYVSNTDGLTSQPTFAYDLYQDGAMVIISGTCDTPPIGTGRCPTTHVVSGERLIRLVLDPNNTIPERDEDNNVLELTCSSDTLECQE